MAKKNTRKGSTKNTAKNTAVKTTVNDTASKNEATEAKETATAKEAVVEKAAEVKEAIITKAEEVKEEVKEAAVKAKTEVKKAAEKNTTVKKDEKPAEAPKRGRKPAAAKAEDAKAAKKPAAKKAEKFVPEVFIQFGELEAAQADVVERVKAQFVSEGHRAGNIKSLRIYIKPEDKAAYYVINDKNAGRVDLF